MEKETPSIDEIIRLSKSIERLSKKQTSMSTAMSHVYNDHIKNAIRHLHLIEDILKITS